MRNAKLLAPIAVFALAAAACGGDDVTPSGGGTTSPPATSSPLNNEGTLDATGLPGVTLELDDFYFKPTFLKATPGQALNIELENEGNTAHTFTITGLNIDHEVAAGGKKEIDMTLPSGTADVAFFCRFHGSDGMRGAFFFGATPNAGDETDEPSRY